MWSIGLGEDFEKIGALVEYIGVQGARSYDRVL